MYDNFGLDQENTHQQIFQLIKSFTPVVIFHYHFVS